MKDVGLLILRLVVGLFVAGHGAQKLFGWFKGPGLKGTSGFMEMLGVKPGHIWGPMAGFGEFAGGMLTVLGFLSPFGSLNIMAAMSVAVRRVHWKLPLWVGEGGAELAATNFAAAAALAVTGPGRYSLDSMFGIRIPRWLSVLATLLTVGTVYAATQKPEMVETIAHNVPMVGDLIVETRPIGDVAQQSEASEATTA